MDQFNNSMERFGSAGFASRRDLSAGGVFRHGKDSVLIGFSGGAPIYDSSASGIATIAGARTGKGNLLGFTLAGGSAVSWDSHIVALDPKAEQAAVSRGCALDDRHAIYCMNSGRFGLADHRINPFDYMRDDSPYLVSDIKVACEQLLPLSGSANGEFFELRGRERLEAFCLSIAERDGVVTPPALYEMVQLSLNMSDTWLDRAFEMSESRHSLVRRVEEEIAEGHKNATDNASRGIAGETLKALACLSDPALMASVSPPYDFSFEELVTSDHLYNVFLCPPAEFIGAWAPIIKAMFTCGLIYKSRSPSAPRQLWVVDEAGNIGKFPLLVKLYTIGAGMGIKAWSFFQATKQISALGKDAETILLSSAGTRQIFGVRDYESAEAVSKMIGQQTLDYDDDAKQAEAAFRRRQAAAAMMNGGDPFQSAMELNHYRQEEQRTTKQGRWLMDPAEVLKLPKDKQIIFTDAVANPIYCGKRAYYEQRFMAGRYFPNPYHPPLDRVRCKSLFGWHWRNVIEETVPDHLAHFPQYKDGLWQRLSEPNGFSWWR